MSQNSKSKDDVTNLGETIGALWGHKIIIAVFTGLSIFLAGFYALNAEKIFTAEAIFVIENKNRASGFELPGELGVLTSLAQFAGPGDNRASLSLVERVTKREFILEMKKKFSLDRDPFFNTYDPDYKDPLWKATIKKMIGWQN